MKQKKRPGRRGFDHATGTEHAIEHILIGTHDDIDEGGAPGDIRRTGSRAKTKFARTLKRWRRDIIADDIVDAGNLEPLEQCHADGAGADHADPFHSASLV
jgi:hypothetical protein